MSRRAWTLVLLMLAGAASAAPKAELWARWDAHDETSKQRVDHGDWEFLLQKHVRPSGDGINRLVYDFGNDDKVLLDTYLQHAQTVPVTRLARAEQRAYWINLYNAATVKLIVDHYPVASIMEINNSPGLFARGPWGRKWLKVEGQDVSLDDIEHRVLRPIWKDPRTHYAVNCASIGCPNLAPHAYTPANLEQQLEEGARAYVNHPRAAQVRDRKLRVSSIYLWFKDDFGGSDAGVIAHLRKYAAPALAQQLAGVQEIDDDTYDWSLNNAGK